MTRELIIEGQHVDLAPDTDITLEYASNIVGDIGKISLSHSYTIKLPKTLRNTRILDDPDNVSHQSSATRRYLSARFYRNGIDLIGPAQAYILKTAPESYEIALVWNTLEALQTLSQSDATLNDLHELPTLQWVRDTIPEGVDYTGAFDADGAYFAKYDAGLDNKHWPDVLTDTHPCMSIERILAAMLNHAGVAWELSPKVRQDLENLVILAAPNHAPSKQMQYESGVTSTSVRIGQNFINVGGNLPPIPSIPLPGYPSIQPSIPAYKTIGWNAEGLNDPNLSILSVTGGYDPLNRYDSRPIHILLNLRVPAVANASPGYISIWGSANTTPTDVLFTKYFEREGDDWVIFIDEDIDGSDYGALSVECVMAVDYAQQPPGDVYCTPYRNEYPQFSVYYVMETIDLLGDNRFPIPGNLPDIKQWDLLKACQAAFGWVLSVNHGRLSVSSYNELFQASNGLDWSSKVDMTDAPTELGYSLKGWAQRNLISYKEDEKYAKGTWQEFSLDISDATLAESRKYYELPFAATMQSLSLRHYKIVTDKEGLNEVEDINIAPRLLKIDLTQTEHTLDFPKELQAPWLKANHYARLQEIIRKPITIAVNIRLNELDLAQLDITRPVYLAQFGHYYAILKVQTSETDLCKVELLQIA